VAQAAVASKSPAIIQVSEGAIKYMGLKPLASLVSTVAKDVAVQVPIALHLDHGRNLDYILGCIDAGFSSVHIDASHLPLDENIILTKQVVDFAHAKNVWVQGEVGAIMGGHGDISGKIENIPIAKLEEVDQFVKKTGVDTIAAAIGTAHGVYDNEDILMDLLVDIKKATKIPFVLHGGSGVDEKKIVQSIKLGVNIINIGSDIKIAFSQTLIKNCKENPKETDPRNLLGPSIKSVEDVVCKQMKLFGSAGKIKPVGV
jgi:fructose-bisphosphate aldolase class II